MMPQLTTKQLFELRAWRLSHSHALSQIRKLPLLVASRGYATTTYCRGEPNTQGFAQRSSGLYARQSPPDVLVMHKDLEHLGSDEIRRLVDEVTCPLVLCWQCAANSNDGD